jgi:tetratricopeptide (TPR) repeat protein
MVEAMLLDVVRNCPAKYVNQYEKDGEDFIKFWDNDAFFHFVLWQKKNQGLNRSLVWIPNAYPRALYYLGFVNVNLGRYEKAIDLFDRGRSLEPTNPKFVLETAHALARLHRFEDALSAYSEIRTVGPHVSPVQIGVACRGRGFLLIKMGDLDGAEEALKMSLEHDPGNQLALAQLGSIAERRDGTAQQRGDDQSLVGVRPVFSTSCVVCGQPVKAGSVIEVQGRLIAVCDRCLREQSRPPPPRWQFWKKRS